MSKKYRMLREGETKRFGDETFMTDGSWKIMPYNVGKKIPSNQVGMYRRKIKPVPCRRTGGDYPVSRRGK
jgi:hypothetical protein